MRATAKVLLEVKPVARGCRNRNTSWLCSRLCAGSRSRAIFRGVGRWTASIAPGRSGPDNTKDR
eukprot:1647579-Pyramimonas_sp.AAC.1